MKKILIIPAIYKDKHKSIYSKIDLDWYKFAKKINIQIVPFFDDIAYLNNFKKNFFGIIFIGGGDIYKISKKKEDLIRDTYQKKLIKFAIKKKIKCLFICRSFQQYASMNNDMILKSVKKHVKTNHKILNKQNLCGLNVNSYHNYSLFFNKKKYTDKIYNNIFLHKDNSIELVQNEMFLGMMFHPERKNKDQKKINKIVKNFFNLK